MVDIPVSIFDLSALAPQTPVTLLAPCKAWSQDDKPLRVEEIPAGAHGVVLRVHAFMGWAELKFPGFEPLFFAFPREEEAFSVGHA